MTTGMNVDVYNYMFGSILTMSDADVALSVLLSVTVIVLFVVFYDEIFAVTFDETFAHAAGIRTHVFGLVLSILTGVTIVVGMKMMGAIMISAIIIFPSLTAMRLTGNFRRTVILSAVISVACFIVGFFAACLLSLQTGAAVVTVNLLVFCAVWGIAWIAGKVKNRSIKT